MSTEPLLPAKPRVPPWQRLVAALDARFPVGMEKARAYLDSLPLPSTRRERRIFGGLGLALALTLAAPFVFRPSSRPLFFGRADTELSILTPHNETIRREFTEGFQKWFRNRTGKTVRLDWRTPGGTSEIAKVIGSEYHAAFENYWNKTQPTPWQGSFGSRFTDAGLDSPPGPTEPATADRQMRQVWLNSAVGIGVDLFFGGGVYDFEKQRKAGTLVAADASGKFGPAALRREKPEWFTDAVIPQSVGGEAYYDPGLAWVGSCLSSFGIVYNRDAVARLGLPPPQSWSDLTDFRYYGRIAVADPSKSGSIVKAFEMIIQQQMRAAHDEARGRIDSLPPKLQQQAEDDALRTGLIRGMQILQRIGANARYFTDAATKVPHDVAQGVAAAGMCIDFYGRTFNEKLRAKDGTSRVAFVTPLGGTSTGVDSIAMFRGAPHPEVAHAFLEFVLSPEGQALWNYRAGTPGGPRRTSLRRLPLRKDVYTPDRLAFFADPDILPYQQAGQLVYEPAWTASSADALKVAVRVMCIDTHDELCETWKLLASKGFPPKATAQFSAMGLLVSDDGLSTIARKMKGGDKLGQVKLARTLGAQFRRQYELARRMAERGE